MNKEFQARTAKFLRHDPRPSASEAIGGLSSALGQWVVAATQSDQGGGSEAKETARHHVEAKLKNLYRFQTTHGHQLCQGFGSNATAALLDHHMTPETQSRRRYLVWAAATGLLIGGGSLTDLMSAPTKLLGFEFASPLALMIPLCCVILYQLITFWLVVPEYEVAAEALWARARHELYSFDFAVGEAQRFLSRLRQATEHPYEQADELFKESEQHRARHVRVLRKARLRVWFDAAWPKLLGGGALVVLVVAMIVL